jgi:hypothetical protein
MSIRKQSGLVLAAVIACMPVLVLFGQQTDNKPAASTKKEGDAAASKKEKNVLSLPQKQNVLSGRYRRFERTMRQVTEYLRKNNPEQASLLVRAINRSSEERIRAQMEQISQMLEREQFGDARERQTEVVTHLRALLYLLQSENILDSNKAEQQRIKDLIKDVGKLIAKEKDARTANERGEKKDSVVKKQKKVADATKRLQEKIDRQDGTKRGDPNSKQGDPAGKQKDGKPGKGKPGDKKGKSKDGKSKDGQSGKGKSGKGKPKPKSGSKSGNPQREKSKQKKNAQQAQNDSQQNDPLKTPGRDEIKKALQEMNRAIEKLQKENREGASTDQDKALNELLKAKEKLEEILRQLREEEREILLAALEARFQKMLQLQILVYNGTRALSKTPNTDWGSRQFGRSRELSQRENDIALDAAKALDILKEEGSSVAFPESVAQMREDMLIVARRLEEYHVGDLTQAIEQDIIEALQETIEALQKELEKIKDKEQQEQQEGEAPDPPLVDNLAELKMLRSLQYRINRRTRQLGRLFKGEQAKEGQGDILKQLRDLAGRQKRIQKATYNIATGRNK